MTVQKTQLACTNTTTTTKHMMQSSMAFLDFYIVDISWAAPSLTIITWELLYTFWPNFLSMFNIVIFGRYCCCFICLNYVLCFLQFVLLACINSCFFSSLFIEFFFVVIVIVDMVFVFSPSTFFSYRKLFEPIYGWFGHRYGALYSL